MNEIKADVLKIPRKWNKTLARAVKKKTHQLTISQEYIGMNIIATARH